MSLNRGVCVIFVLSLCFSEVGAVNGKNITAKELQLYFSISPTGAGLPPGSGNAEVGAKVYERKCAICHGNQLQGVPGAGGPALVGGRSTLKDDFPLKTVESYWPYATTLFDYIWRAMPFYLPGSLTANEVYALCAFILTSGKVIDSRATIDAISLPKVKMPNADGFYQEDDQ